MLMNISPFNLHRLLTRSPLFCILSDEERQRVHLVFSRVLHGLASHQLIETKRREIHIHDVQKLANYGNG